jgi:hypothetical protein
MTNLTFDVLNKYFKSIRSYIGHSCLHYLQTEKQKEAFYENVVLVDQIISLVLRDMQSFKS